MKKLMFCLLAIVVITGCSGAETIPGDPSAFVATGYTHYAWRSEPRTPATGYAKDKLAQADPAIRDAVDGKMRELGYTRVDKDAAQFLVEYLAAPGVNAGLLGRTSSNVTPYPSATINRQIDGASVDNAYALGGAKTTGNLALVFVDAASKDLLWQLRISTIIEDANRVDTAAVRRVIRSGLASLPDAP